MIHISIVDKTLYKEQKQIDWGGMFVLLKLFL